MNKSEGVFLQANHQYIHERHKLLTYANLLFYIRSHSWKGKSSILEYPLQVAEKDQVFVQDTS